jgi:MarR family transcriptional regulator, transcriptional regulator for hemolysin
MTQLMPDNSLGFLLTDLSRLFRQAFERSVGDAGLELTPGEIRALAHVARYGGARQAVLAERMGVEPMTLSAYLDRLEARNLIVRTTDPTDRRAKVISHTARANDVIDMIRPLAEQIYVQITDGIEPGELKTMEKALLRIRGNLAQHAPFAAMQHDLMPMAASA